MIVVDFRTWPLGRGLPRSGGRPGGREGHAPQKGENTRERGYPGAHADVPAVTTQPGVHADDRCRLRATIYTDDCPKDAGGL